MVFARWPCLFLQTESSDCSFISLSFKGQLCSDDLIFSSIFYSCRTVIETHGSGPVFSYRSISLSTSISNNHWQRLDFRISLGFILKFIILCYTSSYIKYCVPQTGDHQECRLFSPLFTCCDVS